MRRRAHSHALWTALLVLGGSAPAARATDPMPERLWPVPLEPGVASNFCEYREGHLHAGIDVRTYGREGIQCLAAADGYVARVRATPSGYGQAVYVQLDEGETLVYAHLAEFAPSIDSLVVAEQRRVGRYSVDLRLPADRIRVGRGDIIAYSGSTGGVDPHLHFEVRNAREEPLDPFARGFALEDTVPPVIRSVVFVPLSVHAGIDGGAFPLERDARETGPGRYTIDDTVGVDSDVGLQVRVFDPIDANSGRLAPKSIEVFRDDYLVSRVEFQAFSFAQGGEVGFVYDLGHVRRDGDYYYQLYPRPGATLGNRTFNDGGCIPESPADSSHFRLRVVVADAAGNRSELTCTLLSGSRASRARARAARVSGVGDLPGLYIHEDMISVQRAAGYRWEGRPDQATDDPFGIAACATAADLRDTPGSQLVEDGGRPLALVGARAGESRRVAFPGLGVEIGIEPQTLYGDAVLYATEGPRVGRKSPAQLVPRSSAVRVGPYSLSLKNDMILRFAVDAPDSEDAVFRMVERSGHWVYYASRVDGDTVTTSARRPGVYAVFADHTPPAIRTPVVGQRLMYATGKRVPELRVAIDDSGSGVDYDRSAIFLAGIKQIARWDVSARKFFVLLGDENIMGPQALTVVAYDNIGHRTQLDTTVDIPRRTRR